MRGFLLTAPVIAILTFVAFGETAPQAGAETPVVVTRDDGSLPARCGPRTVGRVVAGFLDAYSRGDVSAALARWERGRSRMVRGVPIYNPRRFQWYSLTEDRGVGTKPRHFVAHDRVRLRRQIVRRARFDDTMRLSEIRVSYDKRRDLVAFEPRIERSATDLAGLGIEQPIVIGKGSLRCTRARLIVMSLSHNRSAAHGYLCPASLARTPAATAIVCTSR